MTQDQFWNLIEQSRVASTECEAQTEALTAILAKLPVDDIVAFDHTFREHVHRAYRWDLWAVAYIINGGCGDDGFDYFRCWLIGQGQSYYEEALKSPERAANNAVPGDITECEELAYASNYAYEKVTGAEMPVIFGSHPAPAAPAGEPWEEEDLETLYPELYARFA
jgi:hypothetical protein